MSQPSHASSRRKGARREGPALVARLILVYGRGQFEPAPYLSINDSTGRCDRLPNTRGHCDTRAGPWNYPAPGRRRRWRPARGHQAGARRPRAAPLRRRHERSSRRAAVRLRGTAVSDTQDCSARVRDVARPAACSGQHHARDLRPGDCPCEGQQWSCRGNRRRAVHEAGRTVHLQEQVT